MKEPFVTVGVIARNEEKHIQETIFNLIKLNYPTNSYEIIVIDGNSKDKTRDIVNDLAKKSKVSIKIFNEKDYGFYGPCFARNLVVKKSSLKSDYIAYTDADCKVDKDWLKNLVELIENKGKSKEIAGVGGPRLIYKNDPIKAKIINYYLSSFIGSGGSSAFSKKQKKFAYSIANYNALYKKKILIEHPYDDKLILADDNELNYRLVLNGFKFLYTLNAKVWHHEDPSIKQFAINMRRYGDNISRATIKHEKPTRWFTIIPTLFDFGLFFGAILSFFSKIIFTIYVSVIGLYLVIILVNSIQMVIKSKSIFGLLGIILAPIQHICYGWGFFIGLFKNKNIMK
jgi:cellulose synthase/poly-beta-1,6-N-acetylglucosamine synthase-like glycosyltransferase